MNNKLLYADIHAHTFLYCAGQALFHIKFSFCLVKYSLYGAFCLLVSCLGGHDGEVDVGNLFNSMLGRGDLRIVGATTFCQYKMYIQGLDLEGRFQKVLCDNLRMTWFMTQCFIFIGGLLAY